MAQNGGQGGPVTELAHQAADRVHGVAGWLEEREPGDLLNEVKGYARRNPGTFLVGAAVLGVLAGRLTKGLTAGSDDHDSTRGYAATNGYDPEQTAVIPTPPAPGRSRTRRRRERLPRPDPRHLRRAHPGYSGQGAAYPDNGTGTSYADPAGGTGQPLPPVTQTDPLPGVPSTGTTRP